MYGASSYASKSLSTTFGSGGVSLPPLSSSPLGINVTFAAGGGVDGENYHIFISQGDDWELRRATYRATDPPQLLISTLVDSSATVNFDPQLQISVLCVIPGVQSELTALFQ